jgi:hypothetical protein
VSVAERRRGSWGALPGDQGTVRLLN